MNENKKQNRQNNNYLFICFSQFLISISIHHLIITFWKNYFFQHGHSTVFKKIKIAYSFLHNYSLCITMVDIFRVSLLNGGYSESQYFFEKMFIYLNPNNLYMQCFCLLSQYLPLKDIFTQQNLSNKLPL